MDRKPKILDLNLEFAGTPATSLEVARRSRQMKTTTTVIAILALATCLGEARAQEIYAQPPAPEAPVASLRNDQREARQAADRALAELRQKRIDDCEQNHGSEIDCAREVDTEMGAEQLQSGARVIRLRPAR